MQLDGEIKQQLPLYKWEVSDWSECSVSCGLGIQTRNVRCKLVEGNDEVKGIDENCPHPMPATLQSCQVNVDCNPTAKWRIVSNWGSVRWDTL